MPAWVVVQCLARALLRGRRRLAGSQSPVECPNVTCGASNQDAGAHRCHCVHTATDQLSCHTAEGVVRSTERALTGSQHSQLHTAVLEYLCQCFGGYRIELAFVILESQLPAPVTVSQTLLVGFRPGFKGAMTVEVEHMDGQMFGVTKSPAERGQRRRS